MSLDRYGGSKAHPLVGGGTTFRVVKRGRRFLLATPDGNAFWLKACYGVDITDGGEAFVRSLHAKHSSDPTYTAWGYWWPFVAQAVRNLRQWGFNALGEYTSNYAMPVDTNHRGRGNSERMPFIALTNAANYAKQRYGVKDLMFGVDEAVTPNLWRVEGFPDVFDPAFARAVDELTWGGQLPWLLGSSTDDRDYLFGFGPSRTLGGWHNHLGWQAAATRPTQTSNHRVWVGNKQGVTYADTTVHTKLALRDHLRSKYRALEELNAAWGSSYATWDSDGTPWPKGRGLLDESGRSPWLGRDFYDALQFANEGPAAFRRGFSLTRKPFFVWTTFMAQADSPQSATKGWPGVDLPTQEERGRAYAKFVNELVAFRADDDTFPCVGIDWWAYCDKVTGGESHNFGLVTKHDNPYDGVAARVQRGRDASGHPIGGETRDYGDFLSHVKAANDAILDQMRDLTSLDRRGRHRGPSLGAVLPLLAWLASPAYRPALTRRQMLLGPFAASGETSR